MSQSHDAAAAAKPSSRPLLRLTCWLYLLTLIAAWWLLYAGEAWWPATVLLFGPRWLLALPLVALLPLAFWRRRRFLSVLLAAAVVVFGPVMGFVVPWDRLFEPAGEGTSVRVLTCNMHYRVYDSTPLDALLRDAKPDIVVLQEWHEKNQSAVLAEPGWHIRRTYSLMLASRFPIRKTTLLGKHSMRPEGLVERCELDTPAGITTLFSLHLASPRLGLSQVAEKGEEGASSIETNSDLRWRQSEFIARQAEKVQGPLLLAGDFNTTSESLLFRRTWDGYTDAFTAAGWGWGYTFKTRILGTRIDHILLGKGWRCTQCWVGPFVGSPHRPLLADIVWTEPEAQARESAKSSLALRAQR